MKIKHMGTQLVRFVFAQPNMLGIVSGTIWFCFSLTPSLLPRPWMLQAIASAISFAFGYGVGVFLSWAIRKVVQKEPPKRVKQYAWPTVYSLCAGAALLFLALSLSWQNDVRHLVGEPPTDSNHRILILLVATLVTALIILFARMLYWLVGRVDRVLVRWIPHRVAGAVAVLVVAVLFYLIFTGVIFHTFKTVANNVYRGANNSTPAGVVQPVTALRSGSMDSLVSWKSLGKQGRRFVGTGPTQTQLQTFSGRAPAEPIRIYVGVDSADSAKTRAELAVKELERTGAFDRPVLMVATPTGTGWVNPPAVDALEYMWNGDTATVAIQYSYLPSWISFLVDRDNATDAGRELFNQVYAKWSQLPEGKRPKLVVFGLSLGSFGGQAAFSGEDDLKNRTSGALFMGTPSYTFLWKDITKNRDARSPEWQPVYHEGKTIRFGATGNDLQQPGSEWAHPRVAYIQHASDPVVWLSPDLLFHKPDWLKEPHGPDVSPNVHWFPVSTFLQIAMDQFVGASAENNHGHTYLTVPVDAFNDIVAPPVPLTAAQNTSLKQLLATYSN